MRYSSADFDNDIQVAAGTFITAQDQLRTARAAGDAYVLDTGERVLTLVWSVLSPIFAMGDMNATNRAAIEDLERALRLYAYADAILSAYLARLDVTQTVYLDVYNDLVSMQGQIQGAVVSLRALL